MNITSTLTKSTQTFLASLVALLILTLLNAKSYAQGVTYANEVSYETPGIAVANATNAISTSPNTFARVRSSSGILLGAVAFQGELELKFASVVPAGRTTYIRINNANPDLLNTLLGGNLGNLLTNVVGNVVLGDRFFEAGARMGSGSANNVLTGNSANPFATENIKLIKDANGFFYIALTPVAAYDRVYIKDFTNALLGLGASSYTDVYYAFYGNGTDPCAQAFATSFEGSGLTLDLLGLGKAGVTNQEFAIDADQTNFSQISLGALGIAGSISQDIYFQNLSTAGDDINIKIQAPSALLNAGLLNNVKVTAYNGTVKVDSANIGSLLNLDLLGLLNGGQPATIPFSPNGRFDRVKVTISSLLNASLTQTFNLYSVTRSAGRPTFAAPLSNNVNVCSGTAAQLRATTLSTNQLLWYDVPTGGTPVTTAYNAPFTTTALTANKTYYVSAKSIACAQESARVPVTVTLNPIPALPVVSTNNQTISSGQTATLRASADAGNTIQWFTAATGGVPIATGTAFTTPALSATTTYYVGTESDLGCTSASRVPVTVTVVNGPVSGNCNAAIAQQTGIDGVCLLCSIQGAGNSTDNISTNFTRISLAVGVDASGYQRLIFGAPGAATDSIRLDLETPTGLADLSVLGGVTIRVMNGTTVVATYPLNSSLLSLRLLSGNRFRVTVPANGVYDRVEVRLSQFVSALDNINIYGAEVIYPNPTIANAAAICAGSPTTLTATPNGGTSLRWFAEATGGTALATGNSFTTPSLVTTTTYYVEVSKGTCANLQRVPVTVSVNPAIVFAGSTLTNATLGSAYAKQLTAATGGSPVFTYTLAAGSTLPARLTLTSTGTIAGTPSATGNATFSVVATDTKGCSTTAEFKLNVTPALVLPAAVLPNGTVGTTYPTQTIPAATGGTTPYTYAAINLPPGLAFNETTREITGTPSQSGTFVVPVTATDGNGNTVTRDYTIIVRDPLLLPTATLANGTVGVPYPSQTIPSATGGSLPYVYSAPVPLAPGLTFNPSTREITGTPTQSGTFNVPVTVVDADNKTVTTNYTIVVGNPLVLAPKVLVDGTVGVVYPGETIPEATGGTGNYTYTSTALPAGLTFNATNRQITGTPTQSGAYNITISVADGVNTVSQTYALRVGGVLSLPTASLPNGTVGAPYAPQTLPAVSGGTAPYTYSVVGLPPGLTFNPATRVISGTPSTGGPYNVTMTARDNTGLTTSTDYAIQVVVNAPVVASVSTCSGTSVTLSVSNPVAGATYRCYASTGNTSIFTGPSFTTPALSASTTYYLEAVSGTAVSTRTQVNVTVNPAPELAVVSTNNVVISAGQSTTLQATADAGNTIQWFAAATGGSPLATGTFFNTPVLNATSTYYVQTANPAGCVSATRVPVTVTVSGGPANPNCNAAVAQQTAIDGLCVLCNIQGAGNSTDANLTNFTRINLAVGVGASGYQRLIFANPGTSTDSIRLDLETPTGLADLSVLSGITVRVMNGSTVVGTYPLNSALINLQLLGGNRFKATVPAGAVYDRVEVRFSALVAALSNLNIYGAVVIYPNPTVSTSGLAICAGNTASLSAVANGGSTLTWFASATGGTALASGENFTTPVLNATTTYYIEVSKGGCANPERVPVTVTVTPVPATPVVATVAPICSGSTAILNISNPVSGITYTWYASATGGTALGNGTTFTTSALTADATYYVEASAGSCVSSTRTAVSVTVSPIPDVPVITSPNETISAGQTAVLTATATNGNTINWYATSTGGTVLASGSPFVTAPLTATTTYYAEAINAAGCTSATRVPVTVTVVGGTPNPNCNAANSQQSSITGLCLLCSIQNPGNAVDDNLTNFTTLSLPVGVGGSAYQRLIFPSAGVGTDSIRVDLETPGGLADVTVLGGIQVRIMNGGSVVASYNLSSSLLNLTLLSGNRFRATFPAVGNYDRVEVRATGLASVLLNVRVYGAEVIYPNPTVSANGQTICAGTATVLSASANGGTTLRWYTTAVGGTPVATGENFTTPTLTATTTYYIEVSKGSCANTQRVPVTVTVTTPPAAPVVAVVAPVCPGSPAIISVSAPTAGTIYTWFTASTGGTPIFTGPVFTSPALTANTTYFVEAANGSCVAPTRTSVGVTVNPLPALPQVQASSTTVNAGQSATLTATSTDPTVTFNWYDALNSSNPVFTGQTFVTPALTATTTYYVEAVSALGCVSPDKVQVTLNVIPGTPEVVPCEAATTQTNGVDGVALFAGVVNPNLAVDNDRRTSSSLVMPVGALNASVFQRLGFATTSNVGDTVKILLSSPSRLLSLGVLSNIQLTTYNNTTSNNDPLLINSGLINLQLLSGGSQALISFVPTQQFNQVEVRLNSGLAGALTSINVNYLQRAITAPEVAAANVTVCETQSTILTVQNPRAGITYRWYDAAGIYQTGKDGNTFTTPAISANTTYSVEAVTATGCVSSRTPVNITVTPLPIQPTLLASTVLACLNTDVVLTVGNPQPGYIYTWRSGGTILQTGTSATLTIVGVTGPVTYTVTSANSCGILSAETTATVDVGTPTPPTITPVATTINTGERVVLTATSTTAGATFTWYNSDPALGGATVLSTPTNGTNGTFLTDQLTTTTTFWVTSTSGACTSAAASVVVTVNGVPAGDAVLCEAAIGEENNVGGLVSILAGVDNANQVFDNNKNTGSSLRIPIGIGSFVYQRAIFDGPSLIGDKVNLKLVSPSTLLSIGLLQNVQITTYNGQVSNNDTRVITNPLLNLQLLSGNTEAVIEFTPAAIFDRVEVRLSSGLLGALTSINFNYAQRIVVPPTVQSATANACVGAPAVLAVQNPVAGVVYRWYLGGTYLSGQDGPTINTDATLAAGSYDYFVTAVRNGCESAGTKVILTVLPTPASPVPTGPNPVVTCPNVPVTLSVDLVAATTFNWYDAAGTLLAANTRTYTTSANLTEGTYNYFVEAVNANSCASAAPRTQISVIVKPNAVATDIVVAGNSAAVCAGTTATLNASSSTVTNPIFNWYTNAALTNLVFTGAEFKPVLTASTTYYVTVSGDNKCENTAGNANVVVLNVNPPATAADLSVTGAENAYCAGVTATLTATSTTVTSPIFRWYSDASLTTLLFTGVEYKPLLTATTTFYVTVQGSNKCENLAADAEVVVVNVNPPATAADINIIGDGSAVCVGTPVSLTATTNTVLNPIFTWYSDPALTNVLFTGPTYNAPALTATTTFYVTVKGTNVCENTAATAKAVVIVANPPAIAADIVVTGADSSLCAGTTASLTATSSTVTNPIFTWYDNAALTNVVFIGSTFNTPALSTTTTYYVTVKGTNRCENTAATAKAITLTVNPPATAADIAVSGTESPFCNGFAARLVASSTTVTNPIFTWYADANLTTVLFRGPVFNTPALTATTTYFVTVSGSNRCENLVGSAEIVTVTVNPPAVTADIIVSGADVPFCSGSTATLSASSTTVTNPIFMWYTDAALTNAVFTGPVLTIPSVSTSITYYVTVRGSNKCENVAGTARVVNVVVNPLPDVPVISSNGTNICSGDPTVLTVQNAQIGVVYQWYDAAIGGTLVNTGSQFNTPALNANADYYVMAISASGCGNPTGRVKVTVTVTPKPAAPTVAAPNVNTCSGNAIILSISNPIAGITYRWYNAATGGTLLGTGVDFVTPSITSNTTFYAEASNASCASASRTPVTVIPNQAPAAPVSISGAGGPQCLGTATVLTVDNPNPALTYRWYTLQSGGTLVFEGSPFNVSALANTTTFYVESVNRQTGCVSPGRTPVTVTVLPKLEAPIVVVQSVTATSVTFQWATVAGATGYEVSIDNGFSWIPPTSSPTGTTYTFIGLKPDQTVSIRVRAIGQLACQLSDATTQTGKADNPQGNNVFIPNTFTPNGDGKNDIFYVYGNTVAKLKLRVYNQWGQFLYESLSIQNGWDGTYRGELQPNGVYVYYVDLEFNDGTKVTRKGTITLLR